MTATDMIQLGVMSLADADRISYMMLEKGVKIEKLLMRQLALLEAVEHLLRFGFTQKMLQQ